jgi:hypothetical protein
MGSGPLYGMAYKFGLTVFMENMRVHGSFMDATEFRHGPVEMLEREKPAVVVLLGTDESRPWSKSARLVQANGPIRSPTTRQIIQAPSCRAVRLDDPASMVRVYSVC